MALPGGAVSGKYWLVQYTVAQNSVSSRLDPTGGVAGTATGYIIEFANTAAEASAAAKQSLGSNASSIGNVTGPYGTSAQADAAQSAAVSKLGKATQAGTIPNPLSGIDAIGAFFNALGEANTWIRVSKVVVGGLLLIIGLVHITGAGGAAANVARKVPLPI